MCTAMADRYPISAGAFGHSAAAYALDPVLHVVLIVSLSFGRFAIRDDSSFSGQYCSGLIEMMFDRSVAAENAIVQFVVFVAEGRLPGHDDVLRENRA